MRTHAWNKAMVGMPRETERQLVKYRYSTAWGCVFYHCVERLMAFLCVCSVRLMKPLNSTTIWSEINSNWRLCWSQILHRHHASQWNSIAVRCLSIHIFVLGREIRWKFYKYVHWINMKSMGETVFVVLYKRIAQYACIFDRDLGALRSHSAGQVGRCVIDQCANCANNMWLVHTMSSNLHMFFFALNVTGQRNEYNRTCTAKYEYNTFLCYVLFVRRVHQLPFAVAI